MARNSKEVESDDTEGRRPIFVPAPTERKRVKERRGRKRKSPPGEAALPMARLSGPNPTTIRPVPRGTPVPAAPSPAPEPPTAETETAPPSPDVAAEVPPDSPPTGDGRKTIVATRPPASPPPDPVEPPNLPESIYDDRSAPLATPEESTPPSDAPEASGPADPAPPTPPEPVVTPADVAATLPAPLPPEAVDPEPSVAEADADPPTGAAEANDTPAGSVTDEAPETTAPIPETPAPEPPHDPGPRAAARTSSGDMWVGVPESDLATFLDPPPPLETVRFVEGGARPFAVTICHGVVATVYEAWAPVVSRVGDGEFKELEGRLFRRIGSQKGTRTEFMLAYSTILEAYPALREDGEQRAGRIVTEDLP